MPLIVCSSMFQSWLSSSRRMISRTALNPPSSLLTLLGLRVRISRALSSLPLTGLAVPSLSASCLFDDAAGMSSHSSPPMLSCLRKKGHSWINIPMDSLASAVDIGTGEDFTIAWATSDVGSARRLRVIGEPIDPVTGVENNLKKIA